jgi:homoserine O-succinyltransferase
MPVLIDVEQRDHHLFARVPAAGRSNIYVGCLDIGLVNNMPDSALMSTERQIFDLLDAAAGELAVRLHFYTMPTTPRSDWGSEYVRRHYRTTDEMLNGSLDGIIVTGAEPKAARLTNESYWGDFAEVADWASENTISSVYSCLAVHGVVLHRDGIERHALPDKCIGVFVQTRTADHSLVAGLPRTFRIPHARWNEVREEDLSDCGYCVLSRSAEAGVDCFVKQQKKSLFVHFQGHPEYETQTLLGEYRRDIGRFLRGENEICPTIPKGYFDVESERLLTAFRDKARSNRTPEFFAGFPVDRLAKDLRNVWHRSARRIYRNWLLYMASPRAERVRPSTAEMARRTRQNPEHSEARAPGPLRTEEATRTNTFGSRNSGSSPWTEPVRATGLAEALSPTYRKASAHARKD